MYYEATESDRLIYDGKKNKSVKNEKWHTTLSKRLIHDVRKFFFFFTSSCSSNATRSSCNSVDLNKKKIETRLS